MSWFLIAFTSTLFWSATNFIDKYLISRYFKERGIAVLMIFSALIGLALLPVILIIKGGQVFDLPWGDILILLVSGIIYVFAILPYFFALRDEDASLVAPFFQSIPVFSYFLGLIFLGEQLTGLQMIAALLIILGAVGLSADFSGRKKLFRWRTFGLMMLSSFLYSLNIFFQIHGALERFLDDFFLGVFRFFPGGAGDARRRPLSPAVCGQLQYQWSAGIGNQRYQ